MNKSVAAKAKRDWWKIAAFWFLIIALLNIGALLGIIYFASISKIIALQNMFDSSSAITIVSLTEGVLMLLIPYLYFKKNMWAIYLTIVVYILFEGGLKLLDGRILPASLSIGSSLFFIYKVNKPKS